MDSLHNELIALAPPRPPSDEEGPTAKEDGGWMEVGAKNKPRVVRSVLSFQTSPVSLAFGGRIRMVLSRHSLDSVSAQPFFSLLLNISESSVTSVESALASFGRSRALFFPRLLFLSLSSLPFSIFSSYYRLSFFLSLIFFFLIHFLSLLNFSIFAYLFLY